MSAVHVFQQPVLRQQVGNRVLLSDDAHHLPDRQRRVAQHSFTLWKAGQRERRDPAPTRRAPRPALGRQEMAGWKSQRAAHEFVAHVLSPSD
ncbi:MAG: hypothetical protein CMM02_08210 [Rhodopirellula sp.]|nr:hypothetical protein [Rhodopirellula sp.]